MGKVLSLFVVLFVLSSCTGSGLGPAAFSFTKEPIMDTGNQNVNKIGKACGYRYLSLVAFGDYSVNAAKRDGNISEVSSVDSDFTDILGIYTKRCTVVRGN
ncbi:TRL-like family protein [Pseudomonadota bacterium]